MSEFEKVSSTSSDSYSENTPGGKTVDEYRQDEEQELEQVAESLGYPEAEAKKIAHEYIADEQNS